ncbi:MAG TPA: acyl carrier protein [Aeromicrobium sp.]|nr:acyl carrier protein [Aeromicrobium sp.]HKY58621.1 acyl carrier protein [Aeromicrobium sp.]
MPTPEEIRSKLTELLGQIANTPAEAVRDTATLKDLGIDSVAIVELAEGVSTAFELRLPDDAVNEWRTVGDVVRSVQRGENYLASLPPPHLNDPERVSAFKQLAIVFALLGAGVGVFLGVAGAALLISSGFDGGSLPPISAPVAPTSTPSDDPFGDAGATPAPTSAAPAGASLTLTPAQVRAGEDFRLSGRLPSARDGAALILEWREEGGTWAPFPITITARPDGTFESRVYIGSPGERQFRVRSSSGPATPTAVVRIR